MNYTVPVLKRTLMLLNYLRDHPEGQSLTDLVAVLDIPKTTVFRILKTLEECDYVTKAQAADRFVLSTGCLRLGLAVLDSMSLEKAAQPVLADIAASHGIACKVSIPLQDSVMCIAKEDGKEGIGLLAGIGAVFPYHAGATGKLLLAFQDAKCIESIITGAELKPLTRNTITKPAQLRVEIEEIHRRGFATDCSEYKLGIGAIAFPIRDHKGAVVAGLSGVFLTEQSAAEDIAGYIESGAAEISRRLGYRTV